SKDENGNPVHEESKYDENGIERSYKRDSYDEKGRKQTDSEDRDANGNLIRERHEDQDKNKETRYKADASSTTVTPEKDPKTGKETGNVTIESRDQNDNVTQTTVVDPKNNKVTITDGDGNKVEAPLRDPEHAGKSVDLYDPPGDKDGKVVGQA